MPTDRVMDHLDGVDSTLDALLLRGEAEAFSFFRGSLRSRAWFTSSVRPERADAGRQLDADGDGCCEMASLRPCVERRLGSQRRTGQELRCEVFR